MTFKLFLDFFFLGIFLFHEQLCEEHQCIGIFVHTLLFHREVSRTRSEGMLISEYLIQMAKWPSVMKGRRIKKKKKDTDKRRRRRKGRRELGVGRRVGGGRLWVLLGTEVALACGVAGALLFRLPHTHLGGSLRGNLQGQTGGSACWGEGLWLPGRRARGGRVGTTCASHPGS